MGAIFTAWAPMVNPRQFQGLTRSLIGVLAGRILVLPRGRRLGQVDRIGSRKRILEALVERAVKTALGLIRGPVLFSGGILFRGIHGAGPCGASCPSMGVNPLRALPFRAAAKPRAL